jgi:hypothetical protein
MVMVMSMVVTGTACVGGVGRENNGGDSCQSKRASSHHARGSQGCAKHERPRPISTLVTGS